MLKLPLDHGDTKVNKIQTLQHYGNDNEDDSGSFFRKWKPNPVIEVIRSAIKGFQKELTTKRPVIVNSSYDATRTFQLHQYIKPSEDRRQQRTSNVDPFTVAPNLVCFRGEQNTSTSSIYVVPLKQHQPQSTTSSVQTEDEDVSIENLHNLLSKLIQNSEHKIEIILTNNKTNHRSKISLSSLKQNIESGDGHILKYLTPSSVETQTNWSNRNTGVQTDSYNVSTSTQTIQPATTDSCLQAAPILKDGATQLTPTPCISTACQTIKQKCINISVQNVPTYRDSSFQVKPHLKTVGVGTSIPSTRDASVMARPEKTVFSIYDIRGSSIQWGSTETGPVADDGLHMEPPAKLKPPHNDSYSSNIPPTEHTDPAAGNCNDFTPKLIYSAQHVTELPHRLTTFRCTAPVIQPGLWIKALQEKIAYSFLEETTCKKPYLVSTEAQLSTTASEKTCMDMCCTPSGIEEILLQSSSLPTFDLSQLVVIDSCGDFSLDPSVMISMFGFDPRGSPFVPCGYSRPVHLLDDLDCMKLVDIRRGSITFDKNEDGTFTEIGRGSYGVVFSGKMAGINGNVVIKDFHNEAVCWEVVEHEAKILAYLNGKAITPEFHGVLTSILNPRDYSLVQELYGTANIEAILKDHNPLPAKHWIQICIKISECLLQIHKNHIVFNDLKADNILVDLDGLDIRFIDFGMATFRHGLKHDANPDYMAQFKFLAPEVREGCHSTPQSDVFSLGILFGQIMTQAKVVQLRSLWKSCTKEQAIKRPRLPAVINMLKSLVDQ